jgi:hypothetical protein
MRLAFYLRHRHSLLMQFDPFKRISAGSAAHNLKRPLSSAARSQAQTTDSSLDNPHRPTKMSKIDGMQKSTAQSRLGSPARSSTHSGPQRRSGGRSKLVDASKVSQKSKSVPLLSLPQPDQPLHDLEYIRQTYRIKDLKKQWEENPKSPLSNYYTMAKDSQPKYELEAVLIYGKSGWR